MAIGLAAVLIAAAAAFAAIRLGSAAGLPGGVGTTWIEVRVAAESPARDRTADPRGRQYVHAWTMTPDGEAAVTVPPQRRLGVRTVVIDFGPARGRIYTD